jgi:UDP-N-acetylglucosamine--N-acetylmuramyl-(pentapeptide) pyrophosphoryl-undecaprenol N-acetylglucosamine transferase
MQRDLRFVISGGGTGGHIFPAIAIANALKRKTKAEILFVGARGRMEMEKVPMAGYKIKGLPIAGIQRKLDVRNILLPFKILKSLKMAKKILREFKPDVVIGVGGYASGPVLYAAAQMKIPALIQEQNSFAGITNKILGKRVNKICVAYEGMEKFFPHEKIILCGNPVRNDIAKGNRNEALNFFELKNNMPTLLIIGGSLGAETINESIQNGIVKIHEAGIQVIWQTGKNYFDKISVLENFADRVKIFPFIQRMDLAYAAADVVISRAGAISVSELCLVGKPAILVPSPNVAEDHQSKNAMSIVKNDAAILIKDHEVKEKLADAAIELLRDENRKSMLSENIRKLAFPNADEKISDEILNLIKENMPHVN